MSDLMCKLSELERHSCRYVVFTSDQVPQVGEALFCGEPRQRGSSYCAKHHARCWIKTARQRAKLPVSIPVEPALPAPVSNQDPAPLDGMMA